MAKGRKQGAKRAAKRGPSPLKPAQIQVFKAFRRKFLFKVSTTAASSFAISEAQLLSMPGTMCTVVNTTAVAMSISARVKRVSIWGVCPPSIAVSGDGTETVGIRWMGTAAQAANWHAAMIGVTDVSNNPSRPAFVTSTPPVGSSAAQWITADNSGADYVLTIDAPVGSIVEFDMEFENGMPAAVGSFTNAISAGTLGVMYWLTFSALSGTGTLSPIGLATTA